LREHLWEAKTQAGDMEGVDCVESNPKQQHPDSDAPFKPPRVPEKRTSRVPHPG